MTRLLVILTLAGGAVINIEAVKPLTFLNTRQFYHDLEPAESRYKVVAKPVPYKPPNPAPSHFEGVTPTLPVVTKAPEFQANNRDVPSPTVSSLRLKQKDGTYPKKDLPSSKYATHNNEGRSEQTLLPKVSLKDFLENKKKQKLLLEKEEKILQQVKQHSKVAPKTKYETDTVIYPTTTYRPQTFHSSDIAKQLGINSYATQREKNNKSHQKKKEKLNEIVPSYRTSSINRPSNYVEAANYKPELAYGTRKSKEKKKSKSGRRLRLKKVRRKKKFSKNKNSGPGSKRTNREQKSYLLKQKELKNKYQNRNRNNNHSPSTSNKNKSKENEKSSKSNKYQNIWKNQFQGKKKNKYDKKNKKKTSTRGTTKKPKSALSDNKFSSSLFLEDSTGAGGTFKSVRRATKPPKYFGYEPPISNYAAPADHYGGITAYNALLSEFVPSGIDYIDTPPVTPITPNIGN